jgi:predicted Zn-dependent protease
MFRDYNLVPRIVSLCVAVVAATLVGCGPSRPPIPPGEIPAATYLSQEDEQYGQAVLSQLAQQYPLVRNDRDVNLARDVVIKLARAAQADQEPWHVYVLQGDAVVNAAATRGNHVFVWTGMLRAARSEAELATVLAHELGHVLAGHTQPTAAEEASQIIAQVSGQIAQTSMQGQYGALAGMAGILVSEAVKALAVNPESQRQELEADHIGFFLMSDAGYDPRDALSIWERMANDPRTSGAEALQFLSTHPPTTERLEALRALLPQAEERYRAARGERKPTSPKRPSKAPADEPDSFVIGRDDTATIPPLPQPPQRREVASNKWVVVEPSAVIRPAPREDSGRITHVRRGEVVVIGGRIGRWYEVVAPARGYIEGINISPI